MVPEEEGLVIVNGMSLGRGVRSFRFNGSVLSYRTCLVPPVDVALSSSSRGCLRDDDILSRGVGEGGERKGGCK